MLILAVGPSEEHSKHQISKAQYCLKFLRSERNPWVWSCLFFWFSLLFLQNKKLLRKLKIQKENKDNQQISSGKNNKVFKCFRPTLGYVLVFPKVFTKPNNHSRKRQILKKTKDNQTNFGKSQKTKLLKVSGPPLDMGLVCLVVWFPRRFLQNQKNFRENQRYQRKQKKTTNIFGKTNQKNQTHIQGQV